jgi:hypothetical protein
LLGSFKGGNKKLGKKICCGLWTRRWEADPRELPGDETTATGRSSGFMVVPVGTLKSGTKNWRPDL